MKYAIILIFLLIQNLCVAQSPLTDSNYYLAYNEYEIMSYAKKAYNLDNKICDFLSSSETFDKKMAVVDAFNSAAETEAGDLFFTYLKHKNNINEINKIKNVEDKLILSYLYFTSNITRSKQILKENEKLFSGRLSFAVLNFLVNSIEDIEKDECKVWRDFQILDNKIFKIKDMRANAITLLAKSVDNLKYKCSNELLVITNTKRYFENESKVNSSQLINEIYPNNPRNDFAFLGIDLTKKIEDFGLSGVNLDQAKPLLPAPFEICKISKNHFLKEIDFDKQSVVFDKEGNIAMIMLQKEFNSSAYFNEFKAKEVFKKIKKMISDLYGANDEEKTGFAKWNSSKYELAINQKQDNTSIELVYISKIKHNNNPISVSRVDKPVVKPFDKEQNTDIKLEKIVQKMIDTGESEDKIAKVIKGFDQSREEFAKILTGTLNNEKYQIECLTYKGLLVVKIKKRFYDDKPEDYVLSPFIRNLAYDLFYEARKYKGFSEKLKTLFEGVVFQNDFTFNDNLKYETNLGITCNDNDYLLESINKEDFKSLLFTVKY